MKFKQKGRDEQCEPDAMDIAAKVCSNCGVDPEAVMKAFCKPRIKVGTEWVTKGQNIDQATNAVSGIARAIFDRLFKWLIEKCNETLIDPTMKKANFVAVLDIAGFEIFEYNGFEQISINFVNEKLQQFFNHHMFVVEQEEYVSEGIDWVMVDFGMDLQAAIVMFEKPMGLWAILEEESLFPKATDKSFEEKLKASLGKLPIFLKPQSKTDKNAHFAISHYAGIVSYNVTGWLEKNKDPVNDTVVELFKSTSTIPLLPHLWEQRNSRCRFEKFNNSVIDRVFVLFQPSSHIIRYNSSIVGNSKVSILVCLGLRLQEDGKFSKRCLQLFLKRLISSFGEERLFFKNSPKSHGFLKHDDSSLQVHAKIYHLPVNTFLDIFFLLNNKHVVIEKLLELFIDKVDRDLFKTIVFKDLKTSNIQYSTEVGFLQSRIN